MAELSKDPVKAAEELDKRLKKIEEHDLDISDLPVKAIRKKIETGEPMDPRGMFLPGSFIDELLSDDFKKTVLELAFASFGLKASVDTTNFTISAQGGYSTITHSLEKVPKLVLPVLISGVYQITVTTDEYTDSTFRVGAYRTDGPNVGTKKLGWIAIG